MHHSGQFFCSLAMALLFMACQADTAVAPDQDYSFVQPASFPQATYTFENNPVTKDGFELGRMLFYDPILSVDSTVSCSTCHKQATGFADPTHRVNHGVNNLFGKRNSPGIANMAFVDFFFLDGGVNHLDFVAINAITSEVEMGNTLIDLVEKLNNNSFYKEKFQQAFKKDVIDSQQLLYALSQFTIMLVSANSKYDQVMKSKAVFTDEEQKGYALFISNCSSCHATDLFTDNYFHNNGLDDDFAKDIGRQLITESAIDRGKFKTPSLRNAALTQPYMHDGRFSSLDDVLNHYSSGVKDSPSLDTRLRGTASLGIPMTQSEQNNIIAFIKTLTDAEFAKDKRFSDPF